MVCSRTWKNRWPRKRGQARLWKRRRWEEKTHCSSSGPLWKRSERVCLECLSIAVEWTMGAFSEALNLQSAAQPLLLPLNQLRCQCSERSSSLVKSRRRKAVSTLGTSAGAAGCGGGCWACHLGAARWWAGVQMTAALARGQGWAPC